jgi:DNA-binding transcriptional LysR family regulator
MEINLKQLEAFVTTVEYSSFTRAAEALDLTQSTVSAHISALEDHLNIRLIQRGSRRRVQMTREGQQAYELAKDILNRCESLQNLSQTFEKYQLSVGASSVPAQYLLPELMSGFLAKYPDSRYVLLRGDSARIHQLLTKGEVRIGFVGAVSDREHYHYHAIAGDRLVLITANNETFRKLKARGSSGRELLPQPMILREETSGTRRAMEAYLHRCNISIRALNLVAQIDNTEAIKSSVIRGLGVSVISVLAAREEVLSGRLLAFELGDRGAFRKIYLAWSKQASLSEPEQLFLNFIRNRPVT